MRACACDGAPAVLVKVEQRRADERAGELFELQRHPLRVLEYEGNHVGREAATLRGERHELGRRLVVQRAQVQPTPAHTTIHRKASIMARPSPNGGVLRIAAPYKN